MANTDLIAPIIVAIIGLLGSFVSVLLSSLNRHRAQREAENNEKFKDQMNRDLEKCKGELGKEREKYKGVLEKERENFKAELARKQTVSTLTEKYAQPLLVTAYDLQHRLYALFEYPISRQQLEKAEGLEDLKIFTCYLLAQYLALNYVLRAKTGYLSFSKDDRLRELRNLTYLIDEELDRRRDADGRNVGVWPAARLLICERMIEGKVDVNEALDGGFGFELKGFDSFKDKWTEKFAGPMGYFCEWIDLMLKGRMIREGHGDALMRCLQHLVVDVVDFLDYNSAYITKTKQGYNALRQRQESRLGDAGLWPFGGLHPKRRNREYDPTSDKQITLDKVKETTETIATCFELFDPQALGTKERILKDYTCLKTEVENELRNLKD